MINLLHIDDDSYDQEILKYHLDRISDQIEHYTSQSGHEAILQIESSHFDCVITDYQMPGMDGLEFLIRLKKKDIFMPVIFLTGQGNERLAVSALKAGACDYYTKDSGLAHYERIYNSIVRASEIYSEISQRKKIEQKLKKSEERYRSLMENLTEGFTGVDAEQRFIYVNKRLCLMLGYSKEELLGRRIFEFLDEENIFKLKKALKDRDQGLYEKYELDFITKSGKLLYTSVSPQPHYDKHGEVDSTYAIISDIGKYLHKEL